MTAHFIEAPAVPTPPVREVDLVVEANHRIANNLAALATMLRRRIVAAETGAPSVPRERLVDELTGIAGNIIALSHLHRSLSGAPEQDEVDLHDLLSNILRQFQASGIFGDRLRIQSTIGAGCRVEASRASMLALAFSEIVTNAVKYAHPTGLPVELSIRSVSTVDGVLTVQIADDGVGFPEGFVEQRDAGVGLKLVRSLVKTADARLETKSDPLGVIYTIHLPPKRKE